MVAGAAVGTTEAATTEVVAAGMTVAATIAAVEMTAVVLVAAVMTATVVLVEVTIMVEATTVIMRGTTTMTTAAVARIDRSTIAECIMDAAWMTGLSMTNTKRGPALAPGELTISVGE